MNAPEWEKVMALAARERPPGLSRDFSRRVMDGIAALPRPAMPARDWVVIAIVAALISVAIGITGGMHAPRKSGCFLSAAPDPLGLP